MPAFCLLIQKIYINNKKNIIVKTYNALENGITEAYNMGYNLPDLFNRTVEGRVIGVETSVDTNLVIFLGEDYISFADTTIKNQYSNGVYTAMREIYHYDIKDEKVDGDDATVEVEIEVKDLY